MTIELNDAAGDAMIRAAFWKLTGCLLVNVAFWLFLLCLLEPQP